MNNYIFLLSLTILPSLIVIILSSHHTAYYPKRGYSYRFPKLPGKPTISSIFTIW